MEQNSTPVDPATASASAPVTPFAGVDIPRSDKAEATTQGSVAKEVADKIASSQNVLIALSSDPSVDEMAAAIGLTLYLDKLGKHATAIYSGATPNALEFLEPEKTFAHSADALQDFVIALNKDKADHLRYKLDGDYVKIYITPYLTRIDQKDLEFSYGDYNIDLVLALDVVNGADLDSALREHGRIMHDAVIVNITTGNPGKFGEIEWSDKNASSVSEMIATLLYNMNGDSKIDKTEATAFLTGIVAATNRFSNAKTTPVTMQLASRLMESGANQQLVSKNITPEVENKLYAASGRQHTETQEVPTEEDATRLSISHDETKTEPAGEPAEAVAQSSANGATEVANGAVANAGSAVENVAAVGNDAGVNEGTVSMSAPVETTGAGAVEPDQSSALLDDLKEAEASLARAGNEIVPDTSHNPVKIEGEPTDATTLETELNANPELISQADTAGAVPPTGGYMVGEPALPPVMVSSDVTTSTEGTTEPELTQEGAGINTKPEMVIQPTENISMGLPEEDTTKYGKMLETALGDTGANPASMMAPQVASTPEINGVPEMNYMPMPGQEILPPPPTPPIDTMGPAVAPPSMVSSVTTPMTAPAVQPITSAMPPVTPQVTPETQGIGSAVEPLGAQPAMQDQVYAPQVSDPGAFKIPGM